MYRFGVDWAKIEPEEGMFDEEVLAHYKRYCQALVNAGIVPMITIHHFASPSWFAAKGGFTKRENNEYLVRFARKLFTTIGTLVPFWATINEPGILAYSTFGLGRGVFPPGGMDVKKQGEMLLNLLLAHNQIYKTLKALPGGDKVQIGIVHSVVLFEPFEKTGFVGGYQASLARMMQQNVTDAVTNFFSTGEFYVYGMGPAWQPFGGSVRYSCPEARRCNDFVGLNYYTHVLMFDINGFKEKYRPWELRSEMPYALYAEGLYRAIKKIAAIGKPIYITENGFADRHDIRRRECIMRTLWVLQNAIARGYNVRGYLYWSLMDNFEWDLGYNQFFGLYSVDPVTFVRTPRKSAFMYKEIIARHKSLGADALIGTGQHKNILPSGA
jgi:beta-glucosidase